MHKRTLTKPVFLSLLGVALSLGGCARNYQPLTLEDGREVVYMHGYDIDPPANAGAFIPFGSLAADVALRVIAGAAALNAASDATQRLRPSKVYYSYSDAPERNYLMEIRSRTVWEGARLIQKRSWVEVRYDDVGEYFVHCETPCAPNANKE